MTLAPPAGRTLFCGWGRTAPSAGTSIRPTSEEAVLDALAAGGPVIARGLGRSYGDAAQVGGGTVVDAGAFDAIEMLDPETGVVRVGGGVVLGDLMRFVLPLGWFVPVTPGTRQVTVGGAIAADIHGKNHHRDGSFCQHVSSCTLVTPTGILDIGPRGSEPDVFWATAGGMGLTGMITRATVQLTPVESGWMLVDTQRFADLEAVMGEMERTDDEYRYSVAWVDCMSPRGRAVLTRGDHAPRGAVPSGRTDPVLREEPVLKVPFTAPRGLLNPWSVRAFNELWFRRAPRREVGALHDLGSFFHPLDGVGNWNRLYGPTGFVQYQFVVGPDRRGVVADAIAEIAGARVPSFLAVLKRFGPGDPGPLSFPMPGWTLALDFPVGPAPLRALLDRLDELVAGAGGRVYLAKDARLSADLVDVMYPRLAELAQVRRRIDPDRVLRSDLSGRLDLDV